MIAGYKEDSLPVLRTVLEESLESLLLVISTDITAERQVWRGRLEEIGEPLDGFDFSMDITDKLNAHSKGYRLGDM